MAAEGVEKKKQYAPFRKVKYQPIAEILRIISKNLTYKNL